MLVLVNEVFEVAVKADDVLSPSSESLFALLTRPPTTRFAKGPVTGAADKFWDDFNDNAGEGATAIGVTNGDATADAIGRLGGGGGKGVLE